MQRLLLTGIIVTILVCRPQAQAAEKQQQKDNKLLTGKRIMMLIAPGNFRDEELATPKDAFIKAGATVTVVSTTVRKCKGMLGAIVEPDTTLDHVKADDFDAIVLVGGSGSKTYFKSRRVHRLVKRAAKQKKVVAAICLAPIILANAGLLKNKSATVWDDNNKSCSSKLTFHGARYRNEAVVTDGLIVTANGPRAAAVFAKAVIKAISLPRPAAPKSRKSRKKKTSNKSRSDKQNRPAIMKKT